MGRLKVYDRNLDSSGGYFGGGVPGMEEDWRDFPDSGIDESFDAGFCLVESFELRLSIVA